MIRNLSGFNKQHPILLERNLSAAAYYNSVMVKKNHQETNQQATLVRRKKCSFLSFKYFCYIGNHWKEGDSGRRLNFTSFIRRMEKRTAEMKIPEGNCARIGWYAEPLIGLDLIGLDLIGLVLQVISTDRLRKVDKFTCFCTNF